MATIKYGGVRCLALDTKITVPSIKLAKSGATTQYIPLFKGNKNSEIEYNRWIYTLGGLKVGDYHVATSRRWRNSRPLVLLTASSTNAPNGTSVVITASAFDGDGDTIHYSWSNSGGTASGNTYTVSASNTTKTVTCTVSDDWDGGDSASISVTWYEPNIAPRMSWHTPINVNTPGSISITANVEFLLKLYYYDADNDNLSWSIYEPTVGSGGVTIENQIASGTFTDTAVINSDGSTNYYSLPITLDYGSIKRYGARVTDSRGGICGQIITITTPDRDSAMLNGKFFWFDDKTMYRGYYSSDRQTIYITSHVDNGRPFFQIGGFDKSLVGKTVTWKFIQNEVDITSRVTESSRNINNSPTITRWNGVAFRNIDGSGFNTEFLGIKCFEGWMPNGVYDLILTVDNINYVIHLNMND